MEQSEIINLWKAHEQKLEQALSINRTYAQEVLKLKTKSVLSSMNPIKIFTILAGCVWIIPGGIVVTNLFVFAYPKISHFFLYSAAIQLVLTAIAVVIYLYQLVLIQQVDISENVVTTQKKLAYLKSSTLWSARVLFLQLPVWTTFYLSETMIRSGNIPYIVINGFVTMLFAALAIWLFININYRNKEKKWFKLLFEGREWTPIIDSIGFYREIEEFSFETKI